MSPGRQTLPTESGAPAPPDTGLLAALELMTTVSVIVAAVSSVAALTPLGRQPLLRAFLPLAKYLWWRAWWTGAAAWAVGIIPRRLARRPAPLDTAAIRTLAMAGSAAWRVSAVLGLMLWEALRTIPAVRQTADRAAPAARAVAALVTRLTGRDGGYQGTFAPSATSGRDGLFPGGPPLGFLPRGLGDVTGARGYAGRVQRALAQHGITGVAVVAEVTGPTVANLQVALPPGIRASQLRALEPDLAVTLGAQAVSIRPMVGRPGTVAVEVPFVRRQPVFVRRVLESAEFSAVMEQGALPVAMGIDTSAAPVAYDLAKAPHMLVAGATGTGKSVFLNTMLVSMLYTRTPAQVRLVLIDPKQVEFGRYCGLPHLALPPVDEMGAVPAVLDWLIREMEARYTAMKVAGAERIKRYNAMAARQGLPPFPYVVLVVDELADLMLQARGRRKKGKGEEADSPDPEEQILRLAQKARACGIHLVLATQRPSVDVITGTIKANVDARVAFRVSSQVDSKVILDQLGAENLAGTGDLLFRAPGADMVRAQAPLVGEDAVEKVVQWWKTSWRGRAGQLLVAPPSVGTVAHGRGERRQDSQTGPRAGETTDVVWLGSSATGRPDQGNPPDPPR